MIILFPRVSNVSSKVATSFSILTYNVDTTLLHNNWYFVTKIGLTCCEKKLFYWSKITFEIRGWRPRIYKDFLDHLNNIFKQWKVRTTFGNRMFFKIVPGGFSYLIGKMVFCYHNCSNVLWEKIVLVWGKKMNREKSLQIRGRKAENL